MKKHEIKLGANWNSIIISVTLFAILTILVLYLPNMREYDYTILNTIRGWLAPYPTYIPIFVSEFGISYHLLWPLVAACSVLISQERYLKAFMLVLFTQGTLLLKEIIKDYICRERPEACAPGFSFPSGHCSLEMCFLGILIYLINRYCSNKFWKYFLITLFSAWLVLLAISRMWLGAHFLTDVIAGFALGFFMVNVFIILDKSLNAR